MGELDGRSVIVTGGRSGIGRAVALKLASESASVLAVDLNQDAAGAVAAASEELPGRIVAHRANVVKGPEVAAFVDRARQELGGVDGFSTTPAAAACTRASPTRPRRSGTAPSP
jgi:NAD(P)-dependent dehydrogenase (short-subunit alcohol dehydrogenase family)